MLKDTGDTRIQLSVDGAIATITINRPEKLNALDFEMIGALKRAAHLIDDNPSLRVAIITGAGEKCFCAGGDIAAWSSWGAEQFGLKWVREGHRAFDALARLRQPLIAALNGHVLGGGLELASTADYRIAEEHVRFGLPETSLGIIPGWSGTQRTIRRFGSQTVRRMALIGEEFSADEATRLGIADRCVGKGQSLVEALKLAEAILTRGPLATQVTKLLISAAEAEDAEQAMEALAGLAVAGNAELREGVAAFQEKRKPKF